MERSQRIKKIVIETICLLYILLFVYAALSKLLDFENFSIQIGQSPLLSAYAGIVAPLVIAVELVIVALLSTRTTKRVGLYSALFLMGAFTVYIYIILHYSEFIPCSCGGILEKLGWTEHLIFNIGFILLGLTALLILEGRLGMARQKTFWLPLGTLTAASLLVIIFFLSSEHIIRKENNFTRRFLQHPLLDETVFDLKFDSYYFAGYSKGIIYLGNYTAPELLTNIAANYKTSKTTRLLLDTPHQQFRSAKLQIRAPYFYIYDGSIPVIFRGFLGDSLAKRISNDTYFSQLQATAPDRFAFRAQSNTTKTNILGTFNAGHNNITLNYSLLTKQSDGIFDTDGMLLYDQANHNLIYSYFYRNGFLVMDPDLKLLRSLHTIDTVTHAQVKVRHLDDGRHKLEAPPLVVNKNMVANNDLLLVESNLKGKFESAVVWENASVIDIYSTKEQSYLGSFFIEHRGKTKLSQMLLTDEYLFILSGHELLRYRLAQAITKHFKKGEAEKP